MIFLHVYVQVVTKLLEILLPDIDYFEVGIFKASKCCTSELPSLKSLILYHLKEFTV